MKSRTARYAIGEVVRHRIFPFRGIIFDVDPVFANTEEWWLAIPEEVRPSKDQPFYHLLAENTACGARRPTENAGESPGV
jgi:heat shock protein HspQ